MGTVTTLTANNSTAPISGGDYSFVVDGALDLQWDISGSFTTIDDCSFTASETGVLSLPSCNLKVTNASTNSIAFSKVKYD